MSRRPFKFSEAGAVSGATDRPCATVVVGLIGLWLLAAAAPAETPGESAASAQQEYVRGQALFSGTIDLHGRIYTHVADLPARVVRCANCHSVAAGPEVPRSLAPRLTHDWMVRPRARRGGPPSNYDRDRFCALLRRGVDPALVLINVEMPRYTIDDASCRALWRYVIGSSHE